MNFPLIFKGNLNKQEKCKVSALSPNNEKWILVQCASCVYALPHGPFWSQKWGDVCFEGECLKRWYWKASHCRCEVIKDLVKKIKRHSKSILNTIEHGLFNARIEAINIKIKLMLRRSYGFRNTKNMIAFVMLTCSKIDIPLPNRPRSQTHISPT